jgi:hypothetical protein
MKNKFSLALKLCSLLLTAGLGAQFIWFRSVQARTINFNRDIRPILSDKCFACNH